MKKLMTVLFMAVLLFSASAFAAAGDNVTAKVKVAFEKDFTKATDVNWKKTNEFYFASFTMNGLAIDAAYNEAAELICTSRKIAVSQLPLNVSLVLSQKYNQYVLPQMVSELNYEGETKYYITVANAKQTLKLIVRPNGDVTVDKKIKIK